VHVELPSIGKQVAEQESTVVIESVKIAADVYTPVAGKVISINQ
jgi:glycine cleavage system H protein